MNEKTRPAPGGAGSQPAKRRVKAGATGLLLILRSLAQAAAASGAERRTELLKKGQETLGVSPVIRPSVAPVETPGPRASELAGWRPGVQSTYS